MRRQFFYKRTHNSTTFIFILHFLLYIYFQLYHHWRHREVRYWIRDKMQYGVFCNLSFLNDGLETGEFSKPISNRSMLVKEIARRWFDREQNKWKSDGERIKLLVLLYCVSNIRAGITMTYSVMSSRSFLNYDHKTT